MGSEGNGTIGNLTPEYFLELIGRMGNRSEHQLGCSEYVGGLETKLKWFTQASKDESYNQVKPSLSVYKLGHYTT